MIRWGLAAVVLLFIVVWLWPLLLDLGDVLMPRSANLSHILDTDAVGTHWSYQTDLPAQRNSDARHPALAAYGKELVALAWTESVGDTTSLLFASGAWDEEG